MNTTQKDLLYTYAIRYCNTITTFRELILAAKRMHLYPPKAFYYYDDSIENRLPADWVIANLDMPITPISIEEYDSCTIHIVIDTL